MDPELARAMTYGEFTDDDVKTDSEYVEFGAFYLRDLDGDGNAEKVKGTCKSIEKNDVLYFELNVLTDGYFKNGVISIDGQNIKVSTSIPKDNEIKENAIGDNVKTIQFKNIYNGTQKLLTGVAKPDIGTNINNYTGITTVTLTGTHVANDGVETPINKVIELTNDWYGVTKAEINAEIGGNKILSQKLNYEELFDDNKEEMNISFLVAMQETKKQLIIKDAVMTALIPSINGYAPIKVEATGINISYFYNPATQIIEVYRGASTDKDGNITTVATDNKRNNIFEVTATYSKETYESISKSYTELKIPITGFYKGYNNQNSEFDNPYTSNVASGIIYTVIKKGTESGVTAKVKVGKWLDNPYSRYVVSKKKPLQIYNGLGEGGEDYYPVEWIVGSDDNYSFDGTVIKENELEGNRVSDIFVTSQGTEESMEDFVSNVGIYFERADSFLENDGEIKVYNDETNELIVTFNKSNWNNYNGNHFYRYEEPIRHIRIETSKTKLKANFSIFSIKEIDDDYLTSHYSFNQFEKLKYIKSQVVSYIKEGPSGTLNYNNTDSNNAVYESLVSIANINLSKSTISTQETEKNEIITLSTSGNEIQNHIYWKDGIFLIKIPKDILEVTINNVTTSDSSVVVQSYEQFEENGSKFIKINTQNTIPTIFNLMINCELSPNPRMATTREYFEFYAINTEDLDEGYYKTGPDIYDLDGDSNTTELIHKSTAAIDMISPNSLLTNETISDFGGVGEEAIAPSVAEVSRERSSARINIEIKNNYTADIKDIVLLGRVPFEETSM